MKRAKLHYFKGRGRAETTRWMLAINNIDFINISLEDYNDFDDLKASGKLPFNQLPLLELDDLKLSQSSAMISFLARRGDLYGKTNEDAVRCDMLVGAVGDFNVPAMQFTFKADKDEASRDLDESLKKFGKHFEFILTQNEGEFLVGQKLSVADIIMAESLTSFIEFYPTCLNNYPLLKQLQEKVVSEHNINEYLNSSNRWRLPDEQYIIDIARVLCRPLPSHMPEPNRFVKG
jgi:glutathione S-transferase